MEAWDSHRWEGQEEAWDSHRWEGKEEVCSSDSSNNKTSNNRMDYAQIQWATTTMATMTGHYLANNIITVMDQVKTFARLLDFLKQGHVAISVEGTTTLVALPVLVRTLTTLNFAKKDCNDIVAKISVMEVGVAHVVLR